MHKFLEGEISDWYECHLEDEDDLIKNLKSASFEVASTASNDEKIKHYVYANPKLSPGTFVGYIESNCLQDNVLYFVIEKESAYFRLSELKRIKKFAEKYLPPSYQNIRSNKS